MDINTEKLVKWVETNLSKRVNTNGKRVHDDASVRKIAEETRNELMGLNKSKGSDTNF